MRKLKIRKIKPTRKCQTEFSVRLLLANLKYELISVALSEEASWLLQRWSWLIKRLNLRLTAWVRRLKLWNLFPFFLPSFLPSLPPSFLLSFSASSSASFPSSLLPSFLPSLILLLKIQLTKLTDERTMVAKSLKGLINICRFLRMLFCSKF